MRGDRGDSPIVPVFAQIDNIHYISTMRGLSRGFGVLFFFFCLSNLVLSSLRVRGIEEKTSSFRFNYSTPRGAPFSGGTQRGSDATPLRVPARGGVWLSLIHILRTSNFVQLRGVIVSFSVDGKLTSNFV